MKPKGVVLLTHGLNLKPARMDDLAERLSASGYEVFRPAFTGHCGHNKHYLEVDAAHWESDAREFHARTKARAEKLGVPHYLVAYSFSAAVYQAMAEELPFDSRVLFAPAISTRFWYPVATVLANAFPRATYKSMNLDGYYANATSGMKAVQALEHFVAGVRRKRRENDSTPTLVWVDPKDELVSYKGIRIQAGRRPNWKLEKVSNAGARMKPAYHHLIINEQALGKAEWERVLSGTFAFLQS
ncbi:MAG: alpha/beta hydrolase [Bdellovibrionota bacterium]